MFKKILVPVDGSRTSRLGLQEAIKVAKGRNGMLYLFHVVDEHTLFEDSTLSSGLFVDDFLVTLRENGKAILSAAAETAKKAHVRTRSFMVESFANVTADLIVQQAKKLKVDLIVLGTHGRRGLKRLVMGSDAEGVIRNTPVPVMLVRSSASSLRARRKTRTTRKAQPRSTGNRRGRRAGAA
jgi:nucleotide-binding universal stress UspA family protein